jgi:hypothetical protein
MLTDQVLNKRAANLAGPRPFPDDLAEIVHTLNSEVNVSSLPDVSDTVFPYILDSLEPPYQGTSAKIMVLDSLCSHLEILPI